MSARSSGAAGSRARGCLELELSALFLLVADLVAVPECLLAFFPAEGDGAGPGMTRDVDRERMVPQHVHAQGLELLAAAAKSLVVLVDPGVELRQVLGESLRGPRVLQFRTLAMERPSGLAPLDELRRDRPEEREDRTGFFERVDALHGCGRGPLPLPWQTVRATVARRLLRRVGCLSTPT